MRRIALVLGVAALRVEGWAPGAPHLRQHTLLCATRPRFAPARAAEDDLPEKDEDGLSAQFSKFIAGEQIGSETRQFNDELYAHLNQRPEYETSELYKNLRKRVDVQDPMYSELEKAKWRDLQGPTKDSSPGEIIEIVLKALREVDAPRTNYGLELLQRFSSTASVIGQDGTTAAQLREYFEESKYGVLLEWVAIKYTRKLELSFDKKRALQQLRLTTRDGVSVPVTFQMSSYPLPESPDEKVWLIDQLLVKSVEL